jgi:predicted nucleotidyltransferase
VTDFRALIEALCRSEVRFVLVGGVAATLHGSARLTQDVDVVYAHDADNLARISNFTLATSAEEIDLLSEIAGVGDYNALTAHTIVVEIFGMRCLCLDLPTLIRAKSAAGRPRDLEALAELRALLEEKERKGEP